MPLEDLRSYSSIRVDDTNSAIIVDVLSLSTGLDMAINNIKKGEITERTKKVLSDLIAQSYAMLAFRVAHGILVDNNKIPKDEPVGNLLYRFDIPDEDHDDLIIYYKFHK